MGEMKLPPNFPATLRTFENEQLYDMLANEEDYLPEAIAAARAELDSRHVTPELQAEIQQNLAARIADEQQIQGLPLRQFQKILLVVCSGGFLSLIMIAYFFAKGQTRRFKESWRWMGLGLSFWVSLGVFSGALRSLGVAMVLAVGVTAAVYATFLRRGAERLGEQGPSSISSRPMAGAGPYCVSCRMPLSAGTRICPHCGWTQPGQSSLQANQ